MARLVGQPLLDLAIAKPFVLRTVDPPIADAVGRHVTGVRRSGKRIVLVLDTDRFLVIHLMIAGRLRWRDAVVAPHVPPSADAGAPRAARRSITSQVRSPSRHSTAVDSRSWTPIARHLRPASRPRTIRSNGRSPIRGSSAASVTPIRMRFSTARDSRRWRSRPRSPTRTSNASMTRRAPCSPSGRPDSALTSAMRSRRRSPPSARRWPCTGVMGNPVPTAAPPCSGSVTRPTKRITAPAARLTAADSPIVRCLVY